APSNYALSLHDALPIYQGRIVVKRISVVKRVAHSVTVEQTRTIKTAGGTKIVTQRLARYKPVYRPKLLTIRKVVTVTQPTTVTRSEEHTSELQSRRDLV